MKVTRESKWESYDGERKPLKDLDDTHLLNLMGFLEHRIKGRNKSLDDLSEDTYLYTRLKEIRLEGLSSDTAFLKVVLELIEQRGLVITDSAKNARIPIKDKKTGKWIILDRETTERIEIPKSIIFVQNLMKKED